MTPQKISDHARRPEKADPAELAAWPRAPEHRAEQQGDSYSRAPYQGIKIFHVVLGRLVPVTVALGSGDPNQSKRGRNRRVRLFGCEAAESSAAARTVSKRPSIQDFGPRSSEPNIAVGQDRPERRKSVRPGHIRVPHRSADFRLAGTIQDRRPSHANHSRNRPRFRSVVLHALPNEWHLPSRASWRRHAATTTKLRKQSPRWHT